MGKYFGTDGFRGEAGIDLTADHAYKVGRFLGWYYNALRERNGDNNPARIKHRLSDVPRTTVGAVQTNLDALERVDSEANQIAHVAVATGHIVHSAPDMLTMGKGQLRPILIKDVKFTVDIVLHQQQNLLRHLLAIAVDQLDAVIVVGIMAGRDHDTAIKVIYAGNVCHRRGGSDVQQVGVCAGCGQASDQTVLEHIGTATGVLADDDAGRLIVAVALAQGVVVPAQKTTHLVGVVSGQINASFTTEAIGSKIFSHINLFPHSNGE